MKRKKGKVFQKAVVLILMISLSILGIVFVGYGIYTEHQKAVSQLREYEVDPEDEAEDTDEEPSDGGEVIASDEAVIYIGDSRFVGMDDVCGISSVPGSFVVAQVGQGHKWLTEEAVSQAQEIEYSHPEYSKFYYVICLGINDLVNLDKYIETYRQLGASKDLVLVSVGPVGPVSSITNDKVAEFNSTIASLGFPYIDYNSYLMSEGFSAPDGLHYDDDTYRRIYEIITESMNESVLR